MQRRGKGTQARLRDGGRGVLDASRVDSGKGRHDSLRRVLLQVDPPCPEGGRRVAKGADLRAGEPLAQSAVTAREEGGGCWSATHQRAHLLLVGDEAEGEPLAKLNLERIELADRDPCGRMCAGVTVGGEPLTPIRGEVRARCAGGAPPPHCAMNELAWKTSSDDLEARTSAVTSSRCTLWCVRHRDGPPA